MNKEFNENDNEGNYPSLDFWPRCKFLSLNTRKQVCRPGCMWVFLNMAPGFCASVGVPVKWLLLWPTSDLLNQNLRGGGTPTISNFNTTLGGFYACLNYNHTALKWKETGPKGVKNVNTLN